VSRQYFNALITKANGQTERRQLAEDGILLPFAAAEAPITLRLSLQMFDIAGGPVRLDANSGYSVRFRFEPNDIGKVAFQATPLKPRQRRAFAQSAWANDTVPTHRPVALLYLCARSFYRRVLVCSGSI